MNTYTQPDAVLLYIDPEQVLLQSASTEHIIEDGQEHDWA